VSEGAGIELTVAICTYNRCDLLRDTLRSMTEMGVPEGCSWELLVVNNRCTDDTDAVLAEFEGSLPLRRLYEPEAGKSHAANSAVREARGDVIVWTDDDVLVDRGWLRAYRDAILAHPDVLVFGGRIDPHFLGEPPAWVETMLSIEGRIWAVVDPGPDVVPVTMDRVPLGANMALRREAHLRHPFDVRIGPKPKGEIRGEETRVIQSLLEDGERGLWLPSARVRHVVPPERQTLRYFRRFFEGLGRTEAILDEAGERRLAGRPLWVWRQALESEARYRWWRLLGAERRWLPALMDASHARGLLLGPPNGRS